MDQNQLINSRESALKRRLQFLHTELKKANETHLAVLVPSYKNDVQDEIKFVELQLNKIRKARKSALKVIG